MSSVGTNIPVLHFKEMGNPIDPKVLLNRDLRECCLWLGYEITLEPLTPDLFTKSVDKI